MNKAWKIKYSERRLQESVRALNTIVVGNLLLFLALALFGHNPIYKDANAYISLASALMFFSFLKIKLWKSNLANQIVAGVYFLLWLLELTLIGMPAGYIMSGEIGKGIMLDLILTILPFLYTILRITFLFTIIPVVLRKRNLERLKKGLLI